MEIAVSELSTACLRLAIWARICSEMIRLAGPSAARLMRIPEDNFSRDLLRALSLVSNWRWVFIAAML